jgi:hypothetical protein
LFLKYGKDSFGHIENNTEMQLILKFLGVSFDKTLI